jgi:hypothetical protein
MYKHTEFLLHIENLQVCHKFEFTLMHMTCSICDCNFVLKLLTLLDTKHNIIDVEINLEIFTVFIK